MTIAEVRREVSKALWALRQNSIPDRMARTEAETLLDTLVRRMDDEAPFQRDVEPLKEREDGLTLA